MLIIGSTALSRRCPDIKTSDVDLIVGFNENRSSVLKDTLELSYGERTCHYPISGSRFVSKYGSTIVETEVAYSGTSSHTLLNKYDNVDGEFSIADINDLLLLKLSHRYLKNSPHFLKTLKDIALLREMGAVVEDESLLKQREKETYTYSHPKLNVSKSEFFELYMEYIYDHDSIHEAVMLMDKPAYEYYKTENEVECSKELFMAQPYGIKLNGVYEEACVLALERAIIPLGSDVEWAFKKALEKVCTSITSGWFREFAWENYDNVISHWEYLGKKQFHKSFLTALKHGKVKVFE